MLYFDNNATTAAAPEVVDFMAPYFSEIYANPSSLYSAGQKARAAVEEAREKTADFFNCLPSEIYFTSGGTESDNLAVIGAAEANPARKKIITSAIEHPALLGAVKYLEKKGYEVVYLPVGSEGIVDLPVLKKEINKDTLVVSIMAANNETGVIQPFEEAAEIAKAAGALFHTDAVNAAGKIKLDLKKQGFDLLSAAGHKLHGPKGIGVLYVKKGVKIEPLIQGSKQERGLRPGTENVPLIAGLGKAFELASDFLKDNSRVSESADNMKFLENEISGRLKNVRINGSVENRLWNTLNARLDGIEAESLIISLDLKGAALSGGSACASGSMSPSHVLKAMGLSDEQSRSSVRVSTSRYTTREECMRFAELFISSAENLRAVSAL